MELGHHHCLCTGHLPSICAYMCNMDVSLYHILYTVMIHCIINWGVLFISKCPVKQVALIKRTEL